MRVKNHTLTFTLLLTTLFFSGCSIFSTNRQHQYEIVPNAPSKKDSNVMSKKSATAFSLLVTPATANIPYSSKEMYYRIQNAKPLSYLNSIWRNTPPIMITNYLATVLPRKNMFEYILPPRTIGFADYLLIGNLHNMSQTFLKDKIITNLSITYRLVSTKTGNEIDEKTFDLSENSVNNPKSFEQSATNLTQILTQKINIWLTKKLLPNQ